MHKTRLTQNNKAKYTSNAHTKIRRGEREEVIESLGAIFPFTPWKNLSHLGRTFLFSKPREEFKPFKFKRNMRALKRSPREARKDGN